MRSLNGSSGVVGASDTAASAVSPHSTPIHVVAREELVEQRRRPPAQHGVDGRQHDEREADHRAQPHPDRGGEDEAPHAAITQCGGTRHGKR